MGTFGASLVLWQTVGQSINSSTDTAVTWNSARANDGPSSWWTSGSNIVMPWAGPYHFACQIRYNESATGRRCMHLSRTTTISAANFVAGGCSEFGSTTQAGSIYNYDGVLDLAADTYLVVLWQNSGGALPTEGDDSLPYICRASFTYLGT